MNIYWIFIRRSR